ncbi:hypothetical protein, partial [Streptomyces rimosus]
QEPARAERKLTCGFVGKLDTKYPILQTSTKTTGKAKLTFVAQATVTKQEKTADRHKGGGKLTFSLMPEGKGGALEANYEYNQSTETTNEWKSMVEKRREIDIPDKETGWVEGRANGGWYTGYIVYKVENTGAKSEKIGLIPARVLIQAPTDSVPITWVKRAS